jgi:hypothetical protein
MWHDFAENIFRNKLFKKLTEKGLADTDDHLISLENKTKSCLTHSERFKNTRHYTN